METPEPLIGEYTIRHLETPEFRELFRAHRPRAFSDSFAFDVERLLSDEEREARARLADRMGSPFRLNIGIYRGDELAGWSYGIQEGATTFYMVNSAVLPEHQGQGIYTALLPRLLEMIGREGFQVAYSRHNATNNRILVPKLKAGFVITAMEMSDMFGLLVHLSYFFNRERRRLLEVRSGERRPGEEMEAVTRMRGL